jgi:hypothetical protein
VAAALSAYAAGDGGSADALAALAGSRLLVPVVAVLDEAVPAADGLRTEKASHMAAVSTTGRDGRRGLLAFTSAETMRRWDPTARPVPVTTRRAAEAALADGADALVIDLAGPVTFSVDAGELRALAAGWRPVGGEHGGSTWAVAVGLATGQADGAPVEPDTGPTTPAGQESRGVEALGGLLSRARRWLRRDRRADDPEVPR